MIVPIKGLFEAHLNVSNLQRSIDFYTGVLGLPLAATFPDRRVAFVWVGSPGQAMIGLWDVGTSPQRSAFHVALNVSLEDLLRAAKVLRHAGIAALDFNHKPTDQPVVLAWMPAASIYFRDPDNNLLEFIAMLKDPQRPDLGVLSWNNWIRRRDEKIGAPMRSVIPTARCYMPRERRSKLHKLNWGILTWQQLWKSIRTPAGAPRETL